jgi:hypothetical protein
MSELRAAPRADLALAVGFALACVVERLVRPDLTATPALIALATIAGLTVAARRRAPLLGVAVLGGLALLSDPLQSQLAATSVIALDIIGSEPAVTHDPARVQRLCDCARAGGLNIELVALPTETRVSAGIEDLLHRILQEALTNVIKHAPHANVQVRFTAGHDDLTLDLTNDHTANDGPLAATGSRFGLDGLRERIDRLAVDLTVGPEHASGWRLHARVPLNVSAAPATEGAPLDPRL